jgi:hypothetical protein
MGPLAHVTLGDVPLEEDEAVKEPLTEELPDD